MRTRSGFYVLSAVMVVCVLVLISLVHADTCIKTKRHTDSFTMMGQTQPAKDEVHTTWIGRNRFRTDTGTISFIVLMDKKKMYHINHGEKTYASVDLPIDWKKMMPAEAGEMAEQMMQMFKMTVTVTDTGETKKIKRWNCRKYIVNFQGMMSMKQELWATKDIKIDYKAFREFGKSIMAMNPMFKDAIPEMDKIEGYTVYSEGTMSMMGADVKSTEELMEVSEKSPPAGTYDVPAGYSEKTFDPMEAMQKGG